MGDAALAGLRQPVVGHIGDDHLLGPARLGELGNEVADGTGARYNHVFALQFTRPRSSMGSHGGRLHHGGVLHGHPVGDMDGSVFGHYEIVLRGAVGLEGLHPQVLANIVLTPFARIALAANQLRTGRHPIARFEILHIGAHRHHHAGILVPLDHRIEGGGMQAMVGMNLASADSYLLDIQ